MPDLMDDFLPYSAAMVTVEDGVYRARFNWDSANFVHGPDGVGSGDTADAAIRAAINEAKERR